MLLRGNLFDFRTPTLLDRAYSRLRFHQCYSQADLVPKLTADQAAIVDVLKREGTVTLHGYIPADRLALMQREFQQALGRLEFDMPCLAQTRIDPAKHRDLIDNFLYVTPRDLRERGIGFERAEAQTLDQVLRDFSPSTLTAYMLGRSAAYRAVWLDPYLITVIAHYLGMLPRLAEAYVRRNFASPWRTMNHFWHRDYNDKLKLCKMFVFLSDCTIDTGPHEFIKGSHVDYSKLNGKRYFTDPEVDAEYPPGHPQRLITEVKAGSIILEDTRGAHRARMPEQGTRDLGYAVFMPLPARYPAVNYVFPRAAYESLSPLQRAFIPVANVR